MRISKEETRILYVALDYAEQRILDSVFNKNRLKTIATTLSKLKVALYWSSEDNRSGRTSDTDFQSILWKYCKKGIISKMLNSMRPASDMNDP